MKTLLNEEEQNLKCIWMLAGIINYKLCNRNFQCDHCDFDKVMQGILPNNGARQILNENSINTEVGKMDEITTHQLNNYLYTIFSDCKIYLDRFYHFSHLWFKVDSDYMVSVGINNMIIKILQPIQDILLPQIGTSYQKDQPIAWIQREDKTIPFHSPLDGKIIKVNRHFMRNTIKPAKEKDDYIFKMEGDQLCSKLQQSCGDMSGLKYFTESINLVRNFLEITFNQSCNIELGPTLADGGETQLYLQKVLGESNYKKLISQLFIEND